MKKSKPDPSDPTSQAHAPEPILVTGATGYVGGRLVTYLASKGHRVRAAGRSLSKLESRPFSRHPNVELVVMDVFKRDQVDAATLGCRAAFYLIHSMEKGADDFSQADREAATLFRDSCAEQKVGRILYLGGLGTADGSLSKHLESRHEVSEILANGPVPTTTLRASIIIGAGSASFEILRHLVEKLPVMVTPRWVRTRTQPISIENVLDYLGRCVDDPRVLGGTFDIGGGDVLSYRDLMASYARVAGLMPRKMIPVPFLTPYLSSLWLHFVTPVTTAIARPLIEGLRNETVVREERDLHRLYPEVRLHSVEEAFANALDAYQRHEVETRWSDAGSLPPPDSIYPGDPPWAGAAYIDRRQIEVAENNVQKVWSPIVEIGGDNGYYYGNSLWAIRGLLDLVFGGPGLRRGRRNPSSLRPGDALDFWRVVRVEKPRHLKLLAEMRLPGRACLNFTVSPQEETTLITQTATFEPQGLLGRLYWWSVWPLHHFVFNGMLRGVAKSGRLPIVNGPCRVGASDQQKPEQPTPGADPQSDSPAAT